jgi:hypothetical protein
MSSSSHKAGAARAAKRAKAPGPPSAASGELGLAALIGHLVAQFANPRCVYLLERLQKAHCGCSGRSRRGNDGAIAVYETADLARAGARRHLREKAAYLFEEWNFMDDKDEFTDMSIADLRVKCEALGRSAAGKLEELRELLRESEWELQRETKLAEKRALALAAGETDEAEIKKAAENELDDEAEQASERRREVAEERYFLGVLGAEELFEGGAFTEKWEKSGAGHINAPQGADDCPGPCSLGRCALDLYVRKLPLVTRMRREGEGESNEDGDEDGDEDGESGAEG